MLVYVSSLDAIKILRLASGRETQDISLAHRAEWEARRPGDRWSQISMGGER